MISEPTSPRQTMSFAPPGLSTQYTKVRRKPPRLLNLEAPLPKSTVARFHSTCSSALHSRLGWTENVKFLEQFRYTIVASQLLSEHSNPNTYLRQNFPPPTAHRTSQWEKDSDFVPTRLGLSLTGATAFALAWLVRWLHSKAAMNHSSSHLCLLLLIGAITSVILYYYFRRQWLHYLRIQAVESASSFIGSAQTFDAVAFAGTTLVQEVELVSRGYN
ncbi:hypothetical protein MMC28_005427, partial [Mycoblastus sanguinarius]|nr:hypothetical protein [Mycoblastus sanguinarius]